MKLLLKVHRRESDNRRRSGLNVNANHTHPTPVDTSSKYSSSAVSVPSSSHVKSQNLPYISLILLVLLGCALGLTYVFQRFLQETEIPTR